MNRFARRGAVMVSMLGASSVFAAEPSNQDLLKEIETLQAKVKQLEAAQTQQAEKLTAKEVDATLERVLADADRRSQLLQAQGFTAGYSKGKFIIQSEDGNFVLNPSIQFQARYTVNYREEDADNKVDGRPNTEEGFEIRRMKLIFEGNVFSPDTRYKFQWNTNSNNGNIQLEEAYVTQRLSFVAPDIYLKGGQFKDVTFHEERTDSRYQIAADRSLANEVLGGGQTDYVQGVGVIWDDGPEGLPFRVEAGFTDGPNTDNTNFVNGGGSPTYGVADPDFGLYGRAEYLLFGDWKYYDDFSTMGNEQDLLVFGAGAFYTTAGDSNVLFHTFDVQYEMYKTALYAAYYGVVSDNAGGGDTAYDFGCVIQAGYMLTDRWEPFARYSLVSLDSGGSATDNNYNEFTAGVNYYLRKHAAKFTLDVSWLPDGIPTNQAQIGELDPDGDEDQFVLRGQFQLLL
jgi:hypothetical protein